MFWGMKSLSSTKEIKETGIFSFFSFFSKMWRLNKVGKSEELCPTPIPTLKDGKEKLFQR